MIYCSLYANQIHKSCQAAALEVILDHQSYTLLANDTEIIGGNGILSVSMGFGGSLWENEPMFLLTNLLPS